MNLMPLTRNLFFYYYLHRQKSNYNMKIINFGNSLWRFNRVNKITINNATYCSTLLNALPYTVYNDYKLVYTNVKQYLSPGNQRITIDNTILKSMIQHNFLPMSHSRIISHKILYSIKRHGCKSYYSNHCYTSIRNFSNDSIDPIAEAQVPMQFNGIFKAISESAPVKIAQDSLLFVHDYTGLPWWLVIVLTTIMMRTAVTLPLCFYQLYILAKLENLKYEMDEKVKEMKIELNYGIHKYNWSKDYAKRLYNHSVKKQWDKLIIRENCHPAKAGLLVLVQVPLWISLSMSIRNLCYMLPKQDASAYTTYQEFTTDGFLWISNLTIADPFILPVAMGLFNLVIVEISYMNRTKELTKWQKYLTNFIRIASIGMIPIAMTVPSCLSLYWTTSSAFGLFQNLLLLSPKLRRFAGIPITKSESPHPYLKLRNEVKYRFDKKMENPSKI